MTIKTSGVISMSDIAAELGISVTGLNLNDSRCRTLAGVASGAISFSNFYGKSNGTWAKVSGSATNVALTSALRSVTITLNSDGSTNGYGAWWSPSQAGKGAGVYVKCTHSGSGAISGSLNTWVLLTNGQTWTARNQSSTTEVLGTLSFSFSLTGSDTNVAATGAVSYDVGKAV